MFPAKFLVCALVLTSLPLAAQEPRRPVEPKTAEAKENARPSGHVQVEVVLKNEAVFQGVARKGCLVEKCVRHQYRPLADDQRGDFAAGIRVWYYDDLLGFLFIPYRQIESVKVGAELSMAELDRVRAKVEERRQAKEAARAQAAGKPAPEPKKDAGTPLDKAVGNALLDRFPPAEGFSPERYEEIRRGAITGASSPSPKEQEWVKVFPDWLKAYKDSRAPKPEPVAQETGEKKPAEKKIETTSDGVLIGVKTPKAEINSPADKSKIKQLD